MESTPATHASVPKKTSGTPAHERDCKTEKRCGGYPGRFSLLFAQRARRSLKGAVLAKLQGDSVSRQPLSRRPSRNSGKVECAYYDFGGEGIAYHDFNHKNNGSGAVNPADGSYLNEFRMHEGIDISHTKFHDSIDNSRYDVVQPPENQLYVGWTEPGGLVQTSRLQAFHIGFYNVDLLYTSNRGGSISIDVEEPQLAR